MKEQTIVITGGSSGIGEAICQAMLRSGATVVNLDRNKPNDESSSNYHFVQVDLSSADATQDVATRLASQFAVTGLVNNAGLSIPEPIGAITARTFDLCVNLHLRAAILLTEAVLPGMRERAYGRIVNMSTRAILGKAGRTVYSATKAGLVGMTRTWAMELGSYGITVNAIAPGPILTPLFMQSNGPEKARDLIESTLVNRGGTPEDVAHAAQFFLSPQSGFITGQTLHVCGGTSLGRLPW